MPGQPGVEFKVTGHGLGEGNIIDRQRVDPAQSRVEFDVLRQIHRRTDRELVLGVGRFVEAMGRIDFSRFDVDVFLEKIVTGVPTATSRAFDSRR